MAAVVKAAAPGQRGHIGHQAGKLLGAEVVQAKILKTRGVDQCPLFGMVEPVPGGMGGEEASNLLKEYDPGLIAIASSGYTTSNVMSDYKNSAFAAVVPKPYRIKEMSDALHNVLSR